MQGQFSDVLALLVFAFAFIVIPIVVTVRAWQIRKRAAAGRAQAQAQPPSGKEPPARELNEQAGHLHEIFPTLNQAAGDFLGLLSDTDFKGDLALAAEMAGLKMLRSSGADLNRHTPGHMLLGAIPDQAYVHMQRFIFTWCLSNGIPMEGFGSVQIPDEDKAYRPQVAQLEPAFDAICRGHGLQAEDTPYAAALAALKLVAAGQQLSLMDAKTGQYMTYFHIVTASKTVPARLSHADVR